MSLRYTSRLLYQSGMRCLQGMKDKASKCDIKWVRDSSSSNLQARRLSGAVDSSTSTTAAFKATKNGDKLKQAEESLRTVMYLSCWGPN